MDIFLYTFLIILILCCSINRIHQRRLKESILIDQLTGLHNRKIMKKLENSEKLGKKYFVITSDIDHFKNVNDTYGHSTGDIVLKTVAELLMESFKTDRDYVVRFGGEEFNIFIEASTDSIAVIEKRTNEVRESIKALEILTKDMQLIKLTCSFGISTNLEININERVDEADKKLYLAKTTGRNKVIL